MAKRKTIRGAFAKRKSTISSIVGETGEAAHNLGYVIVRTTRSKIAQMVKKSQEKRVIETPAEVTLVIKGLVTFGANEAQATGGKKILVRHISRGYERQAELVLGEGPIGKHAPHLCFSRVILQREPEIKSMKVFQELEDSLKGK